MMYALIAHLTQKCRGIRCGLQSMPSRLFEAKWIYPTTANPLLKPQPPLVTNEKHHIGA
jgi:hypothetical protein